MSNYPDPVTVRAVSTAADGDDTEARIEAELEAADEREDEDVDLCDRWDGGE